MFLHNDLAASWTYRYFGENAPKVNAKQALSCGSNGGGDVVNCFCAGDYHAVKAEATLHGVTTEGRLMGSAQFDVAEQAGNERLHEALTVTCSR